MRKALLSTVASLAIIVPVMGHAAQIDQAGADQIKERLTYYLPKDIADSDFIKVTPAANRYELSLDLRPLLKDVKPDVFTINGLKPFIHYVTPQDDGLWKVEVNDNFDVSGSVTAENKKQDFTYKIDKMLFDGMFDPSISYFTTGTYSLDGISMTGSGAAAGTGDFLAKIDSISADMKAAKVSEGVADLSSTMSMLNWSQTMKEPSGNDMLFSAASMSGTVVADKLQVNALRDLVAFGLDLIKADAQKLDQNQADKLKALLRANMPLTDRFDEQLKFDGVKVSAQGMDLSLESFTYGLGFNGIRQDSRATFNMGISKPVIPAGLIPPGLEGTVPESANLAVSVGNMNLEGVINYALDNTNFVSPTPFTPEQDAQVNRILLKDGKLDIEFKDTYARNAVYDVALAGTMRVDPNDNSKPEVDVTITARDIDKTVKYLQDNAQAVPEFGQASFMLLMMKGFGKAEPDGAMVWNVKIDTAGKVTINGQEMKI